MNDEATRPGRGSAKARAARRAERQAVTAVSKPPLSRRLADLDAFPAETVEATHARVLHIVETLGIEFRDEESLALWREAGARVEGALVRIPGDLLMSLVGKAPAAFTLNARNPERSVVLGGRHTAFGPGYGAPFVLDLDWQRRPARLDDLENFYRLTHMAPAIQVNGGVIVEPTDVPIPLRHLHMVAEGFRLTDKPVLGPVTSGERAEDALAMAGLVFGADFVAQNPVYIALINSNSPRVWDETMLAALKTYARGGQAVLCQPFTMLAASMPANSAAVVALSFAEALAAIALMQIIRPGAPAILGCGSGVASMKTGGPMMGTPESLWALFLAAQMGRYYRLPCRSVGGVSCSKHPDLFAGYEAVLKGLSSLLAGIHFINHAGGMMEGLLTMSYAKCAADYELADMLYVTAAGDDRDGADAALETVAEVAPGGHFLGTAHTLANYPYQPALQDYNTYEQWDEEGRVNTDERGRERARALLAAYEAPDLDPAIDEALGDYVRRRTAELGG
jgi:trimethylamine--corrinoid protein Co-methyltransferase